MDQDEATPEGLAEELLGRSFAELESVEQRVLERVAAGTLIGADADEVAARNASLGERLADRVASIGGSWGFIAGFCLVLLFWMLLNSNVLSALGLHPFDSFPYIFLNLMLSMLAAVQAPVILMSQNRQSARDRIAARHDYEVNLRTTLEIIRLHRRLDEICERLDKR